MRSATAGTAYEVRPSLAIIADYEVQSAVERELVLRLASVLWRLRRATTMETGLFEIQADHLRVFREGRLTQRRRRNLSMQGSGGLFRSVPTPIQHPTASQPERKPGPLDIVRKTIGQHEIATVQTTSLDQTAASSI